MYAHRIHTIDSAPQKPRSALRGLMQRLGLAFLATTLVIGATGAASAFKPGDEGAIRALGDTFANAFVQKNAQLRASLFAEDATFVTPQGDFLQGRVAMVKDFGPEAEQTFNGTTQAAFSNYRVRFHQARCRGRRRAPYRPQCQRPRWDHRPGDTGHLFLRGRPPR